MVVPLCWVMVPDSEFILLLGTENMLSISSFVKLEETPMVSNLENCYRVCVCMCVYLSVCTCAHVITLGNKYHIIYYVLITCLKKKLGAADTSRFEAHTPEVG